MSKKISSEDMKNYYNSISSGYDELYKQEQLQKCKIVDEFLGNTTFKKILDIGCGTGVSTKYFKDKSEIIYGIDPAHKLIEIANKNKTSKEKYIIGDAEKLPFKEKEFDLIISFTSIQNFYDIEKSLQEMKRVGKKYIITFLSKCKNEKQISELLEKELNLKLLCEEKDKIYVWND